MAQKENLGKSPDFAYIPGTATGQAGARCVQGAPAELCLFLLAQDLPRYLQRGCRASVPWYFGWLLSSVSAFSFSSFIVV